MALTGMIYDIHPSPPSLAELARLRDRQPADLLAWCEDHDLLPRGVLDAQRFAAALQLYRHHAELVRTHEAPIVRAPLALYWAETARDWSHRTTGEATSKLIGGTHYTVIRPPLIQVITTDLRGR
jgi:hypothetical protein